MHFLTEQDKNKLLVEHNNTKSPYPAGKTLVDLFEEQVKKTPDKTALVFQGKEFTYRELHEQSNQLGAYLRSTYKIERDNLIGIKLERSEWLIIALLGILKSGAAYVPIDPDYPEKRIDYIISDSKCKALIDQEELKRFLAVKDAYKKEDLILINQPSDLVYVMYTSGTTGAPKGCLLEHTGVINRIDWMWKQYSYTAEDIILQKTTITFDVSVWEIFMPLCWGAKMVLGQKEDIASPARILSLIEHQKITCLHFVPGMLQAFISLLFKDPLINKRLDSLNKVIASGEALSIETVKQWYKKLHTPLHNLYGPTEASIDVSYYKTSNDDEQVVPIGKPIWNTQLYILDDQLDLSPEGIVGEIYIGGVGLSRGYLNCPDLTAEKFILNPFKPGERIYRTGDLGKWLPDGNIQFAGRKDEQIKFNGHRIELLEIKYALQKINYVEQAECIPILINGQIKRLVAFIKTEPTLAEVLKEGIVKQFLAKELPSYMIPSEIITIKEFPHTANLKVDKQKLLSNYLAG